MFSPHCKAVLLLNNCNSFYIIITFTYQIIHLEHQVLGPLNGCILSYIIVILFYLSNYLSNQKVSTTFY